MQIAVAFQTGIVVSAIALGWLAGTSFWEDIRVNWSALALGTVLSLPLAVGVIVITETKWRPFGRIREDFDRIIELFTNCTILDVAILSALAGIGEEALFRGVLQTFLAGLMHPAIAIAIASVIFGACHPISPGYALGAALIGAILGALYQSTGNLLAPILVHGLYDFALLVYAIRVALPRKRRAVNNRE